MCCYPGRESQVPDSTCSGADEEGNYTQDGVLVRRFIIAGVAHARPSSRGYRVSPQRQRDSAVSLFLRIGHATTDP